MTKKIEFPGLGSGDEITSLNQEVIRNVGFMFGHQRRVEDNIRFKEDE